MGSCRRRRRKQAGRGTRFGIVATERSYTAYLPVSPIMIYLKRYAYDILGYAWPTDKTHRQFSRRTRKQSSHFFSPSLSLLLQHNVTGDASGRLGSPRAPFGFSILVVACRHASREDTSSSSQCDVDRRLVAFWKALESSDHFGWEPLDATNALKFR